MVARYFLLFFLLPLLTELYFDHYHYKRWRGIGRWLAWIPTLLFSVYTIVMSQTTGFTPQNPHLLYIYLLVLSLFFIPKTLYALGGILARMLAKYSRRWSQILRFVTATVVICEIFVVVWGITKGFHQLQVRRETVYIPNLPSAFEGYKIVHFSDLHVGTYRYLAKDMPQRVVDSIMKQQADLVVFTGDIQNIRPEELIPFRSVLSQIKAKDGVYSVFGNHDFCNYTGELPDKEATRLENMLTQLQQEMGWTVLHNEHKKIERGKDYIVLLGEDDHRDLDKRSGYDPQKNFKNLPSQAVSILLQHRPNEWQDSILPKTQVSLMLSGHTHGGQINLAGVRATRIRGVEDFGLYQQNDRYLNVTSGIGGVIPIRFDMPAEIVVITLKRK